MPCERPVPLPPPPSVTQWGVTGRFLRLAGALVVLVAVAGALCGCESWGPKATVAGAPPNVPERGDALYEAGDESGAAVAYRAHLDAHPDTPAADRALYRLAVLHAQPDSPVHDAAEARSLLGRLTSAFPDSPYAPAATALIDLLDDIEALRGEVELLREQIEELKRIDLEGG